MLKISGEQTLEALSYRTCCSISRSFTFKVLKIWSKVITLNWLKARSIEWTFLGLVLGRAPCLTIDSRVSYLDLTGSIKIWKLLAKSESPLLTDLIQDRKLHMICILEHQRFSEESTDNMVLKPLSLHQSVMFENLLSTVCFVYQMFGCSNINACVIISLLVLKMPEYSYLLQDIRTVTWLINTPYNSPLQFQDILQLPLTCNG